VNRFRGRGADHAAAALSLPARVGGRAGRVELVGDLRPQLGGSLYLEKGTVPTASDREGVRRKALAAYLDHLALACLGAGHGEHLARFVYAEPKTLRGTPGPVQELRYRFPALDRSEAEARLRGWLEDLFGGEHRVLLPIEAVLKFREPGQLTAEAIRAFLEAEADKERSFVSTLKGPVPDPLRFEPPADPEALAQARLGAFLAAVRQEDLL
jgi:hypothetical protein